jgi:hypothetical protein
MMKPMIRRVSVLLCFLTAAVAFGPLLAADLASVRSVYVLQMPRGMDQYLANRLTTGHILQVVTDPKLADAILTDHIGETFEEQLETLLPSPEPVKKTPPPDKDKDKDSDSGSHMLLPIDTTTKLPQHQPTIGVTKGTLFLVDPKTHQVLWSIFDPSKSSASKDLDRTATEIVNKLKKDLNPNPKK